MRARTSLLAVLAMVGCAAPAEWRYRESLESTPPSAAHAIHRAQLQTRMSELEALRGERLPQAFDPRAEAERRADDIARIARAMADSARQIGADAPAGLDAAERAAFDGLAAELARRAEALARDASALSPAAHAERLSGIDAVCDGCHARFRIPETPPSG